jgi:RimJ/RimL family protein N-acetyltransferase
MELRTTRLVLRDWVGGDLSAIRALARDDRVTRYQTWLRLDTDEACRQWLADHMKHNNADPRFAYSMAVVAQSSGGTVGWLGWGEAEDPSIGAVSFGYALLPEVWSRGYMTEAVRAMLGFVFDLQQRDSIYATCAISNRRSARVLEKAGLHLVSCSMERDEAFGIEEEQCCYSLKRSEFRSENP